MSVMPVGGALLYDPYGEAPSERGILLRLQVYQKVKISQVEVIKGKVNLSFMSILKSR